MNYNRNVVVFTLVTTLILLFYSLYSAVYHQPLLSLDNISIISEILTKKTTPTDLAANESEQLTVDTFAAESIITDTIHQPSGPLPPRILGRYKEAKTITRFYSDTSLASLPGIMHKLHQLKETKKGKIRIAWLGDSMIEGDLLTQTFRKRMQQLFGSYGVGFIPATSVAAAFRTTANHKWTGEWTEENFKTKELTGSLFLSGHLFHTSNGTITLKDCTVKDSNQVIEKSLICGFVPGTFTITVNGQTQQHNATHKLNRIVLDSSKSHSINIAINNDKIPFYGISMEPKNGVIVDNFSFRGITGLELAKLDTTLLRAIQAENAYDLVIMEYGANLMFRPDDSDYSYFQKHIIPVYRKFQHALPNTEFLIISTADRAFRYGETWKTATGINNLVKNQAELAYGNGNAFFNMYQSMGGAGTIVKWAEVNVPTLANKDYIHPNLRGAELLGNMFFDAFMKDFNKGDAEPAATVRYVVSGCKSIIDTKTNLEWYISEDKDYNWSEANTWVQNLTTCAGNWTLPSTEQVLTLFDTKQTAGIGFKRDSTTYFAKMNPVFNAIGHGAWVWTGEDIDIGKAYTVNLNRGIKVQSPKIQVTYPIRVLAVRKINTQKNGI